MKYIKTLAYILFKQIFIFLSTIFYTGVQLCQKKKHRPGLSGGEHGLYPLNRVKQAQNGFQIGW